MPDSRSLLLCLTLVPLAFACGDDGGAGPDDAMTAAADAAVADASADARDTDAGLPPAAVCASDLPTTEHHQYVFDQLLLPLSATQANAFGLDLDGDPQMRPDNALGSVYEALSSQSTIDLQAFMDTQVASGAVLHLLDLEVEGLPTSSGATARIFMGGDSDQDASDNFSGSEAFVIEPGSATDSAMCGAVLAGELRAGPGTAVVELAGFFSTGTIRFPLVGARIDGQVSASGVMTGRIGGAVHEDQIATVLIPAMAEDMQKTLDTECTGISPPCCPEGSTGETLVDLFDEDLDCAITAEELEDNSLISSLLAPDLDLFDDANGGVFAPNQDGVEDSLSLGVGFTAVGADFPLP